MQTTRHGRRRSSDAYVQRLGRLPPGADPQRCCGRIERPGLYPLLYRDSPCLWEGLRVHRDLIHRSSIHAPNAFRNGCP